MSHRISSIFILLFTLLLVLPVSSQAEQEPIPESGGVSMPPAWFDGAAPEAMAPPQDELLGQDGTDGLQQDEPANEADYVENHLVVRFAPDTSPEEKRALHDRYEAKVISEIPALNVQVLELPAEIFGMVSAYQNEEITLYAEPDYLFTIQGEPATGEDALVIPADAAARPGEGSGAAETDGLDASPNDPLLRQQWHHATIDSERAWDYSKGGAVTIAIIDTGVTCSHPDLIGKCLAGYDHVNNDSDPRDDHGHGTHVAGLAAGMTNNALGIAGTGWDAKILPVKALNSRGSGNLGWIANAVTWAADNGADVINMSLGGRFSSSTLQAAVAYAIEKGVPVIAAAGNENSSNPSYPASYANVIGVAATTRSDTKASFSNYGSYIDVAAPGSGILSTVSSGSYEAWNGTSMASPIVAGVAGLLMDQGPCRSPRQIEEILEETAVDLGEPGWDRIFGAGRIDAGAALAYDTDPCGNGGNPTPTPGNGGGDPGVPTPKPQPTQAPTDPPPPNNDIVGQLEVIINQQRANFGLPALVVHEGLRRSAGKHSLDMSIMQRCTHTGSNGSTPGDRMITEGVQSPYGEIVACGQSSPEAAVQAWMTSAGHRAIILCTRCTILGGGYASSGSGYRRYWTANFGADRITGPTPTSPPPPTATDPPPPTATNRPADPTQPRPTSQPGGTDIELRPVRGRAGWVVSTQPYSNHFDSSDTFTGVWNDRVYHGAMQFDLSEIPPTAYVNFARLSVIGRSQANSVRTGTWTFNLMEPRIDNGFEAHGYSNIHGARVESPLLPILSAGDVNAGVMNIFNFSDMHLAVLADRLLTTRRLSLRIDGPTSGDFSNLLSWDTGMGEKSLYDGPVLYINYSTTKPAIPTPTATGPNPPTTPDPMDPPTATPMPSSVPPTRTPTRTPAPTATPDDGERVIEIVAQPEDVGWVRSFEPTNHLGSQNTYTGYYQQQIYHGMVQFDLSQLPRDRAITHARVTLTGQSRQRLSAAGNGAWQLAMLTSDVDAGWHYHGYQRIHDTREVSRLAPKLGQPDLDAGRENLFVMRNTEVRELAWRAVTTGKISFRMDGPRGGNSNVFDWDAGYGGNPPKLTLIMGPPTADNPLPQVPPQDPERVEAILDEVNGERAQAGLRPLKVDNALTQAASLHTWDMTSHGFFDHIGSDGSTPEQRVEKVGFPASKVGQLIAAQNGSAATVVKTWMRSGDHRQIILDPTMTHIGAAYDYKAGAFFGHYWTVVTAQAK